MATPAAAATDCMVLRRRPVLGEGPGGTGQQPGARAAHRVAGAGVRPRHVRRPPARARADRPSRGARFLSCTAGRGRSRTSARRVGGRSGGERDRLATAQGRAGRLAGARRGPGPARRPARPRRAARRPAVSSAAGASGRVPGPSGRTAPPPATRSSRLTSARRSASSSVEGVADRGEQLRGGLLLPALDLREVAEADPGGAGDVAQRAALTQPVATQGVPELGAQQRHGRLLSCERGKRRRPPVAPCAHGTRRPGPGSDPTGGASADGVTPSPERAFPERPTSPQSVEQRRPRRP